MACEQGGGKRRVGKSGGRGYLEVAGERRERERDWQEGTGVGRGKKGDLADVCHGGSAGGETRWASANANRNCDPATQRRFATSSPLSFSSKNLMPAQSRRSANRSTSAVVICGRPCLNAAPSRPPSPCVEPRRMRGFRFDGRCEPPPDTSPAIPERRCIDRSRAGTPEEDERTGCSLEGHAPCLLRGCAQRGRWRRAGEQSSFSPDEMLSVSKRRLRSDGPLCAIIPPVHVAAFPEKVAQFAV